MERQIIEKKFEEIGARIKIQEPKNKQFSIDIKKDAKGEYFNLMVKKEIDLMVLDAQKKDRHLVLMSKEDVFDRIGNKKQEIKSKFLCGHDERNWFTCAIPESLRVTTVKQAKQALKPKELIDIENKEGLKEKNKHKRHRILKSGRKIHRQGEFMFIPDLNFTPSKNSLAIIFKNEPMRGGGSHFHYAQFLYRKGGTQVYVHGSDILTQKEYEDHIKIAPNDKSLFRSMMRDPVVYVKGKITHEEHKTIDLGDTWHKVLVNTESNARAKKSVIFLD